MKSVTIKDVNPLPFSQDIFDCMGGSMVFSMLHSGYWQIPFAEEDKAKTVFCCHLGLCEFQRMPFGLCATPSIFQRTMNQAFSGLLGDLDKLYFCCLMT